MATLKIDARPLIVECDGVSRVIPYPRGALSRGGVELAEWPRVPPRSIRVRGGLDELYVDMVPRPHWAAVFEHGPQLARGLIHWPDGREQWVPGEGMGDTVIFDQAGWRMEMDDYGPRLSHPGLNARLNIDQPLYFRYLPPGTFLQGSPEGLGDGDEHPQHPVTLTQGLWLAEPPCTQALWQAVMGKNPSHFKDGEDAPRRPVENVSWDDVTAFLNTLQPLLPPGCEAVLPTESQWEYACRAGTQTEYWWGDQPDEVKANFDITGERRLDGKAGVTPMDRYPPNPWGFFDMHGNLWEWCADSRRDYTPEPARDPKGFHASDFSSVDFKVVRGGSWIFRPGGARAASRFRRPRKKAYESLGFRFALRSFSALEAPAAEPALRTRDDEEASK
jgi:hypothetical protein